MMHRIVPPFAGHPEVSQTVEDAPPAIRGVPRSFFFAPNVTFPLQSGHHATHYWGLTVAEWLTLAAIIFGPILAVATQLWIQERKAKRDTKLWVFSTLMSYRAMILNPSFVQAFNLIDVVFHKNAEVRKKRKEFLDVVTAVVGRDLTPQEIEKCRDLVAEMLSKIGGDLGYNFDHTQIKDTGYYPLAFEKLDTSEFA
jgi:hypothetical protein